MTEKARNIYVELIIKKQVIDGLVNLATSIFGQVEKALSIL